MFKFPRKLGKTDREKMEQYLTSLNEVESRLVASERWIDVPNPATNEVVTRVPQNTQAEMERAVESAQTAFSSWSKTSPLKRQEIMFKYQALIKENLVSNKIEA